MPDPEWAPLPSNNDLFRRLKSRECKRRVNAVRQSIKLFTDENSKVYEQRPPLWAQFLSCFYDKLPEIRLMCVKASAQMMIKHAELRKHICEVLAHRFYDDKESIRLETVTTMLRMSTIDFDLITDQILTCIKERMQDKKFKVRRQACLCLCAFYRKVVWSPGASMIDLKRMAFIKNTLLHMYSRKTLQDRILCQKVVDIYLVPFVFDTERRMNRMFCLYCSIDDAASKAFDAVFRQQRHIRMLLKSVASCENPENRADELEMQMERLERLSEHFADAQAFDKLEAFYDLMADDVQVADWVRYLTGDDYEVQQIRETVKNVMSKVAAHPRLRYVRGTVLALLERSAPRLVDHKCVEYLAEQTCGDTCHFELDERVSQQQITQRAFGLLQLLSSCFPSAFYTQRTLDWLMHSLKRSNSDVVDPLVQIFTNVGRRSFADFGTTFTELSIELIKVTMAGTEKQAKHAVYCAAKIWPQDVNVMEDLYNEALKNAERGSYQFVQAPLATMAAVARLCPGDIIIQRRLSVVSYVIVKSIILSDKDHVDCTAKEQDEHIWLEADELSVEARAKIGAVKFLVQRLLGVQSNADNNADNTMRLLSDLIGTGGNLRSIKMRYAERAHLRLVAGCCFLKLLCHKVFADLLTVWQYINLCYLITDECWHVRERFAAKLHKHLYALRIPMHMMAALALVPLIQLNRDDDYDEPMLKAFRAQVRRSITMNYRRRKDYVRKYPVLAGAPWKCLPEYCVCYAAYLLSHHVDFTSHETEKDEKDKDKDDHQDNSNYDEHVLRRLSKCMWFLMEPMLNRKDARRAPPLLLTKIFSGMKRCSDVTDPKDQQQAKKLWAVCDLGCLLINTRIADFGEMSAQFTALLPTRFLAPPQFDVNKIKPLVFLTQAFIEKEKALAVAQRAFRARRAELAAMHYRMCVKRPCSPTVGRRKRPPPVNGSSSEDENECDDDAIRCPQHDRKSARLDGATQGVELPVPPGNHNSSVLSVASRAAAFDEWDSDGDSENEVQVVEHEGDANRLSRRASRLVWPQRDDRSPPPPDNDDDMLSAASVHITRF